MMYKMRRKPEPTLLLTPEIFNLPRHICMVWEELAFDDAVSYYTADKATRRYGTDSKGLEAPGSVKVPEGSYRSYAEINIYNWTKWADH